MLRPSIGIDWDDVTAPFNSIAIRMANEKYHPAEPYRLEEITSWANEGRTSVIKEFYNDPELYSRQIPTEETKRGIRRLMQIADVFFVTAVSPRFMGVRAEQIMTQFPEFPPENIILGSAKDRVHFDIVLDDAIHNILDSKAEYPVLMRKPWNAKMTGLLSVNTMAEFVSLVRQIMKASTSKPEKITAPAVLALVGPSGSGKREITEALCGSKGGNTTDSIGAERLFVRPVNYCTEPERYGHRYVSEEAFDQMNFFEKTAYAGVRYGTRKEDIQELLDQGRFAVIPVDMCGAIAMKRSFPTHIIYVARDKEKLIADIIDSDYDTEEKTLRILSIDAEKRNRKICDHVIHNDIIEGNYVSGAEKLRRLIATAEGKNAGADPVQDAYLSTGK